MMMICSRDNTGSAGSKHKAEQPQSKLFNKQLEGSLSVKGNPKICPKPYPSAKFVVSHDDSYDVENSKCELDETITNMKEIQPVELEKVSEV